MSVAESAAVGLLTAGIGLLAAVGSSTALGKLLVSSILLWATSGLRSTHAGSVTIGTVGLAVGVAATGDVVAILAISWGCGTLTEGTVGLAAVGVAAASEVVAVLARDAGTGTLPEATIAISEITLIASGGISAVVVAAAGKVVAVLARDTGTGTLAEAAVAVSVAALVAATVGVAAVGEVVAVLARDAGTGTLAEAAVAVSVAALIPATIEAAGRGVDGIGEVGAIQTGAEGVRHVAAIATSVTVAAVAIAASAAPSAMLAEAGQFAAGTPVAAASMGESPVTHLVAMCAPEVSTEVDGVSEPIETPPHPPERVRNGVESDSGAEEYGFVEPGTDCAEEVKSRIGVDGRTVNGPWIVLGNVDHLRGGRSDLYVPLILDDFLLRCVLEVAGLLGTITHDLYGLHYILRLVVIGIAKVGGPLEVLGHLIQDLGKRSEGLDARVPANLGVSTGGDLLGWRSSLQVQPLVGGSNLGRIGRACQDHGDKIVRIKRDGGDHLLKAVRAQSRRRLNRRGKPLRWIVIRELLLRIALLAAVLGIGGWLLVLRLLRILWSGRILALGGTRLIGGPIGDGSWLLSACRHTCHRT